ncbi:unnamed protein product [Rotaria sp. Silwood2]|nr:unnamed protein product [Rotaria sp. Silwood2]
MVSQLIWASILLAMNIKPVIQLGRSSGILLHITSLPSPYGIGDLGPEAFKFIDFLVETKQKLWQILPIYQTNSPSPYSSVSAFAGHSWLISPDKLLESGLISKDDLISIDRSRFNQSYVHFHQYNDSIWSEWPESLSKREEYALKTIRELERDRIEYYVFVQYIFDQQWKDLRKYANSSKIKIIGDIPMYVDYDSADVWSNSYMFQLDHNDTMKPIFVAGFPSDQGSNKGQNWNMPIYDWNNDNVRKDLFDWWIKRLRRKLSTVDFLRIDHFRGLISHYVIPVDIITQEPNTTEAYWVKTPGHEFLTAITESLGSHIPIIVEDLGDLKPEVFELRDHFHLCGVRILQMGFYSDSTNIYAPHNYIPNSVAYTGAHDNPTILQWWTEEASEKEKRQFIDYIRRPIEGDKELINGLELEKHLDKHICWYFIQILFQSAANGAIVQMQDLLNSLTRMNIPGTESDIEYDGPQNWSWRFEWSQLTSNIRIRLKELTQMYGRDLTYDKTISSEDMTLKNDSTSPL